MFRMIHVAEPCVEAGHLSTHDEWNDWKYEKQLEFFFTWYFEDEERPLRSRLGWTLKIY